MASPQKILAVSHNLNLEGASFSMYELMRGLHEKKVVEPYVMSFASGPLEELYRKAGIPIIETPFDIEWLKDGERIVDGIERLATLIQKNKYKMVYANTFLGYPAIHAAAFSGTPSLWNIRESQDMVFWQGYLSKRLELALSAFKYAQAIVFVSQATKNLWQERLPGLKLLCIPNGFNNQEFSKRSQGLDRVRWRGEHGVPNTATVFLCVGTLHERKGQLDLVRAVAQMPIDIGPVAAVCVGDEGGEYSKEVKTYIESLPDKRRKRIHILPKTYYISDVYHAADVFVCCSRNESYPRTILEAMSAELPIVTPPVFGINEQVRFNSTAIPYEAGDWRGLHNILVELYLDPNKQHSFGSNGGKRLNELISSEKMTEKYAATITSIL